MIFGKKLRTKRLRQKRRRDIVEKIGLTIGLLLALVVLVSQISSMPQLAINTIEIKGIRVLSRESIRNVVEEELNGFYWLLFARKNIALFPKQTIQKRLLRMHPRLEDITIRRKGVHRLVVEVRERAQVGLYCQLVEKCYFIDKDGFIFARAPRFSGNIFFTYYGAVAENPIGQSFLTPEEFHELSVFKEGIRALGFETISFSAGEQANEFAVRFPEENAKTHTPSRIVFTKGENTVVLLQRLQTIITSDEVKRATQGTLNNLEYIDVRFGRKVFFKLKEQNEQ